MERILDVAARIFDEVGYRATTTNDVAAAAGISIGSLYQYFPNKDALLVALAERHVAEASAMIETYFAGIDADRADLDAVVTDLVGVVVGMHELDRLHLLLAHQAPRTPELQQQLDRLLATTVDAVSELLERHEPGHPDPGLTAHLLVAMVDAAVHDVILRQPSGPARDTATDRTVELARSMLAA